MPNQEPLKKGQEVFLKAPLQIYATVIGPRDFEPFNDAKVYCVELHPLRQYYRSGDLELSQKIQSRPASRLNFFERAQELTGRITRRAYELFASRGFAHGHDREDWFRAQAEILLNVPVDIGETETDLTIRADVPGFSEETLEVHVTPRSLCIAGRRPEESGQNERIAVYSERRTDQIFRVLDLPSAVNTDRVDLTLSCGILEIKMSKAEMGETIALAAQDAAA